MSLICPTGSARSLARFVSDVLEEDRDFIRRGFAEGDDTDFIFTLCVDNGYGTTFEQTQSDEASLVISETVVLECECRTGEDLFCVDEVDVVNLQITSTFPRIPRESHMRIVYTHATVRKQKPCAVLLAVVEDFEVSAPIQI